MIIYGEAGKIGIRIEQTSLEALGRETDECLLLWANDNKDVRLSFYSSSKSIQALEFMDYLVQDYVMVEGDERKAQAVLTPVFLQVMMSDYEAGNVQELLERITEKYFVSCSWIYAEEYAQENRDRLLKLPEYTKRRIPWAYVKTTDILKKGRRFYLKSFENESDMVLEASEDLYIMIGCRGEIYHIQRQRFEQTYETTQKKLDVLEQMLDYLPEIRACETGEFITLDEKAHLCYPKSAARIYAAPLEHRTKIFNPYNNGEYFVGRAGDFMAVRQDDLSDIYIIRRDIFFESYELYEAVEAGNE